MKIAIIVNPNAARARSVPPTESFEQALRSIGWDATIERTRSRGDAARLAGTLGADADVLGVIGGDGTLHEVVNGMMTGLPRPIPLVVIPYGAGNDLASVIDCPKTPEELVEILEDGYAARIDVLDIGDRFCVNSSGLGFEGQVNRYSQTISAHGHLRYLFALFRALVSFSCFEVKLTTMEGTVIDGEQLLVSIGNGVRTGGAFYLTPDAYPDDGLIDACVIGPIGRLRVLRLLPSSFKGDHVGSPEITMLRTASLTVESPKPYPMHVDGEFIESPAGKRVITVRSRVLAVLCKNRQPRALSHSLEKMF